MKAKSKFLSTHNFEYNTGQTVDDLANFVYNNILKMEVYSSIIDKIRELNQTEDLMKFFHDWLHPNTEEVNKSDNPFKVTECTKCDFKFNTNFPFLDGWERLR